MASTVVLIGMAVSARGAQDVDCEGGALAGAEDGAWAKEMMAIEMKAASTIESRVQGPWAAMEYTRR